MGLHCPAGAAGNDCIRRDRRLRSAGAVELALAAVVRLAADRLLAGIRASGALPHLVRWIWNARSGSALQESLRTTRLDPRGTRAFSSPRSRTLRFGLAFWIELRILSLVTSPLTRTGR